MSDMEIVFYFVPFPCKIQYIIFDFLLQPTITLLLIIEIFIFLARFHTLLPIKKPFEIIVPSSIDEIDICQFVTRHQISYRFIFCYDISSYSIMFWNHKLTRISKYPTGFFVSNFQCKSDSSEFFINYRRST